MRGGPSGKVLRAVVRDQKREAFVLPSSLRSRTPLTPIVNLYVQLFYFHFHVSLFLKKKKGKIPFHTLRDMTREVAKKRVSFII